MQGEELTCQRYETEEREGSHAKGREQRKRGDGLPNTRHAQFRSHKGPLAAVKVTRKRAPGPEDALLSRSLREKR